MASPSQAKRRRRRRGARGPAAKPAAGQSLPTGALRLRGRREGDRGGGNASNCSTSDARAMAAHGSRAPAPTEEGRAKPRASFPSQRRRAYPRSGRILQVVASGGGRSARRRMRGRRRTRRRVPACKVCGCPRRGRTEPSSASRPAWERNPDEQRQRRAPGARASAPAAAAAAPPAKPARHRKRGGSAARLGFPAGRGITPPNDQSEGGTASFPRPGPTPSVAPDSAAAGCLLSNIAADAAGTAPRLTEERRKPPVCVAVDFPGDDTVPEALLELYAKCGQARDARGWFERGALGGDLASEASRARVSCGGGS